jgi:hypothetical protein
LNQSELAQVLQTLSQQQAAMLQVHADGMRPQRVLVEQMLAAGKESKACSNSVHEPTGTLRTRDALNSMASLPATVDSNLSPVFPAPLPTLSAIIEQHPVEPIVTIALANTEDVCPCDVETAFRPITRRTLPQSSSPP